MPASNLIWLLLSKEWEEMEKKSMNILANYQETLDSQNVKIFLEWQKRLKGQKLNISWIF